MSGSLILQKTPPINFGGCFIFIVILFISCIMDIRDSFCLEGVIANMLNLIPKVKTLNFKDGFLSKKAVYYSDINCDKRVLKALEKHKRFW